MVLSQEQVKRMAGGASQNVVGGGKANLSGYATMPWVDENYLAKAFWSELFIIHTKTTTTVRDREGNIISGPTTVDTTLTPNIIPGSTETTDEETGNITTVVVTIYSIEAKAGFWTNSFISALGLNPDGGGGGTTLLADLLDVNISNPTDGQALVYNGTSERWENKTIGGGGGGGGATSFADLDDVSFNNLANGQVPVYNATSGKWENQTIGGGSGTLTSIGLVMPTGFTVSPATLTANGSFTVGFDSGYSLPTTSKQSQWDDAYTFAQNSGFGTPANNYIPITLGSTTVNVLTSGGGGGGGGAEYLTDLGDVGISNPTNGQVLGYNALTSKWINQNISGSLWGQQFTNGGNVSGSMTGVVQINMTGHLILNSGNSGIYLNSDGTGIDWHNTSNAYVKSLLAFSTDVVTCLQQFYIPSSKSLRIGNALLEWDSTNNALKISHATTPSTQVNVYATGGISALGISNI